MHFLAELRPSIFEQGPQVCSRRFEYLRWELAREGLDLGDGQGLCTGARLFVPVGFLVGIAGEELHLVRRYTSGRNDESCENVESLCAASSIGWLDGDNVDRSRLTPGASLQAVVVAVRPPEASGLMEDQATEPYGPPCIRKVAQQLVQLLPTGGTPAQLRVDQYHLGGAVDVPAPDAQVREGPELSSLGLVAPTVRSFCKVSEGGLEEQFNSIRTCVPDEQRRPGVTLEQVGGGVPRRAKQSTDRGRKLRQAPELKQLVIKPRPVERGGEVSLGYLGFTAHSPMNPADQLLVASGTGDVSSTQSRFHPVEQLANRFPLSRSSGLDSGCTERGVSAQPHQISAGLRSCASLGGISGLVEEE
ncbi:hypothetical protein ACSNN7_08305 [Micromonospora sp. URMC 105]|uniref:hypothetical protein n=1 Tax=Micromonospora sp. URMC 105 TaxID=3423413 RepID=UPI003F1A44C8